MTKSYQKKALKKMVELLKNFAPLLTIIALILSIWKLNTTRHFSDNLREISNSISTKYVRTFPKNLIDINKIVEDTQKKLVIVTDFPSYGYYSNPRENLKYRKNVLAKLAEGVDVKIVFYDKNKTMEVIKKQLGTDFDKIKKTSTFKDFRKFYKGIICDIDNIKNIGEFFTFLIRENNRFEEELKAQNANIRFVNTDLPMFIWLVDDSKAIISFYNYESDQQEVAFRTGDTKLIDYLKKKADSYFKPIDKPLDYSEIKFPKE